MTPREIKAAHFLKKPLQPHVADRRYPALVKLPTGASGNSEPLRHLPMENFAFPKRNGLTEGRGLLSAASARSRPLRFFSRHLSYLPQHPAGLCGSFLLEAHTSPVAVNFIVKLSQLDGGQIVPEFSLSSGVNASHSAINFPYWDSDRAHCSLPALISA